MTNNKTAEVQFSIKNLADKLGRNRDNLMAILQAIVREKHYLSEEDMIEVAHEMNLSAADVYGTASFYTFLDAVPRGQNIIRVCKTISCHMSGKDEIFKSLENLLKIKTGETTHDKKFTLLTANCLGWCHKGPVMLVNNEVFPELTPQKAIEIIGNYGTIKK